MENLLDGICHTFFSGNYGDKTQLAVITMTSINKRRRVCFSARHSLVLVSCSAFCLARRLQALFRSNGFSELLRRRLF